MVRALLQIVSSPMFLLGVGLFWGAALKKIPQGAYVPLIIGSIWFVISRSCFKPSLNHA